MIGYLWFLFVFAGPFVAVAILYLVWAYTARKFEHRFPPLFSFALRLHNNLPKIGGIAVIVVFIVLLFTQTSYYDW